MKWRTYVLCGLIPLAAGNLRAQSGVATPRSKGRPVSALTSGASWARHAQQGYTMKLWLSNNMALGLESWDPPYSPWTQVPSGDCGTVGIGLEYPVGSCVEHLYGAAPWIGGIVNGVRRVDEGYNGDDARHEFLPIRADTARDRIWHTHAGPESFDADGYSGYYAIHQIRVNQRGVDDDGDGRIDEDELDGLDNDGDWNPLTDDLGADGLPDSLEVSCDGKVYDVATNPDPAYDNYDRFGFDRCRLDSAGNYPRKSDKRSYTQNNGIPDHGEPHVDEDYGAVSDNDLYFSATDTLYQAGHVPMGIKVLAKSYAWESMIPEPILPIEYDFINIGTNVIRQVYLAMFADIDIGPINVQSYFTHNYVGYYPDLFTAYGHNCLDRGSTPLGVTLLGASRPLDSLKHLFQWFGFTEVGTTDSVIYSWMSGEAFFDPIKRDQLCTQPTDTRFLHSFGPFGDLAPHDTLRCFVALVSGDVLDVGPNNMRDNVKKAFYWHKRGYLPPPVPPAPALRVDQGKGSVTLSWNRAPGDPGIDPLDNWDERDELLGGLPDTSWRRKNPPSPNEHGGRNFGGFRVWRSEGPELNPRTFALLAEFPVGDDSASGLRPAIPTSFVDADVHAGREYWYAVTSFSTPQGVILRRLDSVGVPRRDTLLVGTLESSVLANARHAQLTFGPSKKAGEARVVPNPYRGDLQYTDGRGFEGSEASWSDAKRVIWFIDLPARATIRLFTVAGDMITSIEHDDASRAASGKPAGQEEWNLESESGRPIASGLYIFSVESEFGTQVGKFVVIR